MYLTVRNRVHVYSLASACSCFFHVENIDMHLQLPIPSIVRLYEHKYISWGLPTLVQNLCRHDMLYIK